MSSSSSKSWARASHSCARKQASASRPWPMRWRLPSRPTRTTRSRSEEHTSELQSQSNLVCRLLLEKKKAFKYFFLGGPSFQKGFGGADARCFIFCLVSYEKTMSKLSTARRVRHATEHVSAFSHCET